jgi:hypothetical protein
MQPAIRYLNSSADDSATTAPAPVQLLGADDPTIVNGSNLFDTAVLRFEQIDYVVLQPRTLGIGVDYEF